MINNSITSKHDIVKEKFMSKHVPNNQYLINDLGKSI